MSAHTRRRKVQSWRPVCPPKEIVFSIVGSVYVTTHGLTFKPGQPAEYNG